MIARLLHDDRGASIVELGVAMIVTAVMSAALVSWMSSAGATIALHTEDDVVVQDLRVAKERIGRELRVAEDVLEAGHNLVTIWVDDDDDDFTDAGERITWYLGTDGNLWRWTDTSEGQVQASRLRSDSQFGYDSPDLAAITQITVTLFAEVDPTEAGGEPGTRHLAIQIHLRNRS